MPLNDKKIRSIMFEQRAGIEERCEGYSDKIIAVVSKILDYEKSHSLSATNIQKKINDECNAVARFLAMQRDQDTETEELDL